ncbi:hypothetical protein G6031_17315, partial [Dietzia sp. CQ4]|nr:hypothetical protein [Dietzia sp. CQ4]
MPPALFGVSALALSGPSPTAVAGDVVVAVFPAPSGASPGDVPTVPGAVFPGAVFPGDFSPAGFSPADFVPGVPVFSGVAAVPGVA